MSKVVDIPALNKPNTELDGGGTIEDTVDIP